MTTGGIVNLMTELPNSFGTHKYQGKLSKKDNVLAAIDLAILYKTFADGGYPDKAMNIESTQWGEVILKLMDMLTSFEIH